MKLRIGCVLVGFLSLVLSLAAQTSGSSPASAPVPPLVNFNGMVADTSGKSLGSMVGITFSLYKDQQGGAPLWTETQNVQPDKGGYYSVMMGSTTSQGLPTALFASGEARWLGVQVQGQAEQPRVLLMSVPYALKALDAETVGGRPASSFLLAPTALGSSAKDELPPGTITGSGTADFVPVFTGTTTIGNSKIFQSVAGHIGINTTTPAAALDVKGKGDVRDTLTLFPKGTHPALSVHDSALSVSNTGVVTFAAGQTFPGTGTVTSVGSGSGLTGGPITTSGSLSIATGGVSNAMLVNPSLTVTAGTDLTGGGSVALGSSTTLNLDTTKVPQLNGANTFTGNQTVNGNLSATGAVSGGSYQIGSNLFAFGSYANANAFLGFAGNASATGIENTASGFQALTSNTAGSVNVASGWEALFANTTGNENTAIGGQALTANTTGGANTATGYGSLQGNTTGGLNTANGWGALATNTTGNYNTANGFETLFDNTTGNYNTASGYQALNSNTASQNTAYGSQALYSNTTGFGNTATGTLALSGNQTGNNNTASGYLALLSNGTGSANTAFGVEALDSNSTGIENTAVGAAALASNITGNDLTCIGYNCNPGAGGLFNATAIGAHAVVGQSNALVLGGTGQYAVKVGIGTTTPSSILTIARGAGHPVSDSWETYSSRRWKANIQTLPDALAKVEHLRGVSYDLKDSGKHEVGVIAEEVGKVVPEVVTYEENGKDARGVDYSRLTALLIEATKEQQKQIQQEQAVNKEQQREIQSQQAILRTQAAAIRSLKSELRGTRQTLEKVKAQVDATQPTFVAAK
jgi:trimeric autotransporter adhesin